MKNSPNEKNKTIQLLPIMFTFFTMGFVDLVGIATNYVKKDFMLSDSVANILTSGVFFWFLIFSIPTGILMNKIGRRKTVVISLILSLLALFIPLIDYNLPIMLVAFCLLGISNTIMQVSLNPLLSNIISEEKLPSALTAGQLIKAVASFAAPIIAAWGALYFNNWRILFLVFLVQGIVATIFLSLSKIKKDETTNKTSTFKECIILLKDKVILLCFLGFACHVGIDVGFNLSIPRILMEKLGITLEQAGYSTSLYFLFRTFGSFAGIYILVKFSNKKFFALSASLLGLAIIGLILFNNKNLLYICIALTGFNNSNYFSILFSQAILHKPENKNEISGLMIMAIFGGTIFPIIMGFASDFVSSQTGAIVVMLCCVSFLPYVAPKLKENC